LTFRLIEIEGDPLDLGAAGEAWLTTVATSRTGATVIALVLKPDLVAPVPAGWYGWNADTADAVVAFNDHKYEERGLRQRMVGEARRVAGRTSWWSPPEPGVVDEPEAELRAGDGSAPNILEPLNGPTIDLGVGQLHLITVTLHRRGALVVALVTSPSHPFPTVVGYLAWPVAGARDVQIVFRDEQYAGLGLGKLMWEYACRSSELVEWIGHPQHAEKRRDEGEAFVQRVGGPICCRCGASVNVPERVRVADPEAVYRMFDMPGPPEQQRPTPTERDRKA
jgi:hypothetical protein